MGSQDIAWKMNPRINISNRKFQDEYDLKEELGKGAFGVVHRCVLKSDKSEYAVKMNISPDKRDSMDDEFVISKRLCTPTGHINIINMFDSILESTTRFMVLELANGGDVMQAIIERGYYTERDASFAIEQIVKGVAFIHSKGYLHLDLKPENLLLKSKNSNIIKITDFGLTSERKKGRDGRYCEYSHGTCGTPSYWSPEVANDDPYDTDADLFSCGVILYQLIAGYLPFWDEDYDIGDQNLKKIKFTYPTPEWDKLDSAKNLISGLLCQKRKRISSSDVIRHPFITSRVTTTSTENRPQIIDAFKLFQERRQRKAKLLQTIVDKNRTTKKYHINP